MSPDNGHRRRRGVMLNPIRDGHFDARAKRWHRNMAAASWCLGSTSLRNSMPPPFRRRSSPYDATRSRRFGPLVTRNGVTQIIANILQRLAWIASSRSVQRLKPPRRLPPADCLCLVQRGEALANISKSTLTLSPGPSMRWTTSIQRWSGYDPANLFFDHRLFAAHVAARYDHVSPRRCSATSLFDAFARTLQWKCGHRHNLRRFEDNFDEDTPW